MMLRWMFEAPPAIDVAIVNIDCESHVPGVSSGIV